MQSRPFLVQFAVRRDEDYQSDLISHYDEDLEINVFDKASVGRDKQVVHLSTMTKTSVESEKADVDRDMEAGDQKIVLGTQTSTRVTNEGADADANTHSYEFLGTQTGTKTSGENSDSDN